MRAGGIHGKQDAGIVRDKKGISKKLAAWALVRRMWRLEHGSGQQSRLGGMPDTERGPDGPAQASYKEGQKGYNALFARLPREKSVQDKAGQFAWRARKHENSMRKKAERYKRKRSVQNIRQMADA